MPRNIIIRFIKLTFFLGGIFFLVPAMSKKTAPVLATGGETKTLEVRGQARSLQMMMLLKSKGDDIHFVKPRKDFRREINSTSY